MRTRLACIVAMASLAAGAARAEAPGPYASGGELQAAMRAGTLTSERLVRSDLKRISALDRQGPRLNSVIALNGHAIADARALDAERRAGRVRGPLHGLTILIKDNIEADFAPTTAGSLALKDNMTGRDSPVVARLRAAGAVILGKTNLSEWADYRSTHAMNGWSAVGGLTRNPYALDRDACGSSSGSGAAAAAGFAWAAIGTETDGSITCPSSLNGLVGLKPTVGLVSRRYVVPISPDQDTPGPMARTVADAAAILTVIAGSDPGDPAPAPADTHKTDYAAALDAHALKGARIGVLHGAATEPGSGGALFEQALKALRDQGAVLVEIPALPKSQMQAIGDAEDLAMKAEFKASISAYLATAAPAVKARTLDQLIAFDAATPAEMALNRQEIFEAAAKSPALTDPAYLKARADARRLAGAEGLDKMMADAKVEAIVAETGPPAPMQDPIVSPTNFDAPTTLPAVAGYPHLTVPMGEVDGLPVGISFIGPAWSEARLLSLGYAFEQATHARRDPSFAPTLNQQPAIAGATDPAAP
jgi:amidase